MKKLVYVSLIGTVEVDADTDDAAMEIANELTFEDIMWSTDFSATDVEDLNA